MEHYRSKTEELSSGTSGESNLSLMRQVEVLQTQHDIATENWNRIETNLQSRIANLDQETEDYASREAYLRKKLKTLTETHKSQTTENESLHDQIDELKSQLAQLNSKHTQTLEDLTDAKKTIKELESACENQKIDSDKRVAVLEEKLKISVDALNQQQQIQQHRTATDRKKSYGQDQFMLDPVPRSANSSPFSQRFSVDDGFGNRSSSMGFPGRRTSSKASLNSLQSSQYMDNSANSSTSAFSLPLDGALPDTPLATHFEEDDSFHSPYEPYQMSAGADSNTSVGRDRRADEGSSRFDNNSISTVGAGPSIQLVNRMSRTIRSLESELSNVKQELTRMTMSKDEAVKDISRLMQETEALAPYKAQVDEMEKKIEDMSVREQTALEMLGEKSEQVQELRADVDDIKSMFKQQIEELVDRLAVHENRK